MNTIFKKCGPIVIWNDWEVSILVNNKEIKFQKSKLQLKIRKWIWSSFFVKKKKKHHKFLNIFILPMRIHI